MLRLGEPDALREVVVMLSTIEQARIQVSGNCQGRQVCAR